mmetsp:Transcript_106877/g.297609  ORF Transcript_106877/g.297609 Transcript_106877/m.297609 type:complete len:456 (+) Transcript_106877:408-1775(+)
MKFIALGLLFLVQFVEAEVLQGNPALPDGAQRWQHGVAGLAFDLLEQLHACVMKLQLALQAFDERDLQFQAQDVHRVDGAHHFQHLRQLLGHSNDLPYLFVGVGTKIDHGIGGDLLRLALGIYQLPRADGAHDLLTPQTALVDEHAEDEPHISCARHFLRAPQLLHSLTDKGVQVPLCALQVLQLHAHVLVQVAPHGRSRCSALIAGPRSAAGRSSTGCCSLLAHSDGGVVWHVIGLAMPDVQQMVPPLLGLLHGLAHLVDALEDLQLLLLLTVLEVTHALLLIALFCAQVCNDGLALKDLQAPDSRLAQQREAHGLRRSQAGRVLEAQRVVVVVTPSPNVAVGGERKGGVLHYRNLRDVLAFQRLDLHGLVHRLVLGFGVAQLTLGTVAPAIDFAFLSERHNMRSAHLHVRDTIEIDFLRRVAAVDLLALVVIAQAQAAVVQVPPPRDQFALLG